MSFSDLGLSPEILQAIGDAGYVQPTPIQEHAIPYVLMGRDVLGCAQTGTGKTASFTLPMIDILATGRARARMPRSLIITPTRELATQIAENFEGYGKYSKLSMALLIGGVSMVDQVRRLDRGVDVLIATPGRLLDHFERGRILLSDIKILVIDEADRMLDMGFIPDVERIVKLLPKMRQTLFFSATMPKEIRRLADAFLMNPKEVTVAPPTSPAATVEQGLCIIDEMDKREVLRRIIKSENVRNALVFCNRKRDVDILYRSLQKHGFNVAALHGDMNQSVRTEKLAAFKANEITILVASDVAARGLDIDDLSHVFNFDVPIHSEDYIHRIGRTGRAGKKGRAFTLATPEDAPFVSAITNMIGKDIPLVEVDGIQSQELGDPTRRGRGRGRGGRSGPDAKPERGPRGGRKAKPTRDNSAASEPVAAKAAADAPAAKRAPAAKTARSAPAAKSAEAKPKSRSGRNRGDSSERKPAKQPDRKPEKPVVGMGDHMPEFLRHPSKRVKSGSA